MAQELGVRIKAILDTSEADAKLKQYSSNGNAKVNIGVLITKQSYTDAVKNMIADINTMYKTPPIKLTVGINKGASLKLLDEYLKSINAKPIQIPVMPVGAGNHGTSGSAGNAGNTGETNNSSNGKSSTQNAPDITKYMGSLTGYENKFADVQSRITSIFADTNKTLKFDSLDITDSLNGVYTGTVRFADGLGKVTSVAFKYDEATQTLIESNTKYSESEKKKQAAIDASQAKLIKYQSSVDKLKSYAFNQKNPLTDGYREQVDLDIATVENEIKRLSGNNIVSAKELANIEKLRNALASLIKAQKDAQYTATTNASKDVSSFKTKEIHNIETEIQKLKDAGIYIGKIQTSFDNLKSSINSIGDSKGVQTYLDGLREAQSLAKHFQTTDLGESLKLGNTFQAQVDKLNSLKEILTSGNIGAIQTDGIQTLRTRVDQLISSYQTLTEKTKNNEFAGNFAQAETEARLLNKQITTVETNIKNLSNPQYMSKMASDIEKVRSNFAQWKMDNSAAMGVDELRVKIEAIDKALENVDAVNLSGVKAQIAAIKAETNAANKGIINFVSQLVKLAKQATGLYSLYSVFNKIVNAMRTVISNVKNVNDAMIELRKVTTASETSLTKYLENAGEMAKSVGTTMTDYINATADFSKLGYNLADSEQLAKAANILLKVGDGIDSIDESSDAIIASMKSFGIAAKDATTIVDKLNQVSNTTSISTGGLADAITRSASALAAGGLSFEKSLALIVAGNEATRDAETTGTALKSLSMRIRGATTELEDAGEEIDDYVKSTSKMREAVLALSGVDIMINENQFKDVYTILQEISEKYNTLTDINKANLIETLFGKLRANVGTSILNNFDQAIKALDEASNNYVGSSTKEFDRWSQSIEASENKAQTALEELSTTFLNSDLVKGYYDAKAGILGFLTDLIKLTGSAIPVVTTLAGILSAKNIGLWSKNAQGFSTFLGNSAIGNNVVVPKNLNTDFVNQIAEAMGNYANKSATAMDAYNDILQSTDGILNNVSDDTQSYTAAIVSNSKSVSDAAKNLQKGAVAASSFGQALKSIGINMAISLAIGLIIKLVDYLIVTQSELEDISAEAQEKLAESDSNIVSINDSLATTKNRIAELKAMGSLSIVEQDELDRLEKENALLEANLKVEQARNDSAAEAARTANIDTLKGKFTGKSEIDLDKDAVSKRLTKDEISELTWTNYIGSVMGGSVKKISGYNDYATYIKATQIALDRINVEYENAQQEFIKNATETNQKTVDGLEKEQVEYTQALSDAYTYLETYLGENPIKYSASEAMASADKAYWNEMIDLYNSIGESFISTYDVNRQAEFDNIKSQFSTLFEEIQKIVENNGEVTAEILESNFPDIIKAFKELGWDSSQVAKYMNETYATMKKEATKISHSFDTLAGSLYDTTDEYSALKSAMDEQASSGAVSAATVKELIALNSKFGEMLEYTATGWQLNTEAANAYIQEQNALVRMNALAEYVKLTEEINKLKASDASSAEIKKLEAERNAYILLVKEIDNATGAYSKYQQAKSTANQDSIYQEGVSMASDFAESNEKGKRGTDDFEAELSFALGENWNKIYSSRAEAAKQASKNFELFFGEDEIQSMENFVKAAVDVGVAIGNLKDGFEFKNGTTSSSLAEALGISEDAVNALLGLISAYDETFTFGVKVAEESISAAESYIKVTEELSAVQDELAAATKAYEDAEASKNTEEMQKQENLIEDSKKKIAELTQSAEAIAYADADVAIVKTMDDLDGLYESIKTLEGYKIDIPVSLTGQYEEYLDKFGTTDKEIELRVNVKYNDDNESIDDTKVVVADAKQIDVVVPVETIYENIADIPAVKMEVKPVINDESAKELSEFVNNITKESEEKTAAFFDKFIESEYITTQNYKDLAQLQINVSDANKNLQDALKKGNSEDISAAAKQFQESIELFTDEYNKLLDLSNTSIVPKIDTTEFRKQLNNILKKNYSIDIEANITSSTSSKSTNTSSSSGGVLSKITNLVKSKINGNANGTNNAVSGASIVDEEGAELILHKKKGTYELGTNDGARITTLDSGDVVYTAEETKGILGRIAKIGKSFAKGLNNIVYRKEDNNTATAVVGKTSTSTTKSTTSKTTTTNLSNSKSSGISSSKSSTKKSSSSSSSTKEEVIEEEVESIIDRLFDWIEVRLSRLSRKTSNFISSAAEAIGFISKNSTLSSAMQNLTSQIDASTEAYTKYMNKSQSLAAQLGVTSDIFAKIENGTMDISEYDSDMRSNIQAVQEYYEKALDAKDALYELREQQRQLASERIQNIVQDYEWKTDRLDAIISNAETQRDLKTAVGIAITESDYTKSIEATTKKLSKLSDERTALVNEFTSLMTSGYIVAESEEWYDYQSTLENLDETIISTKIDLQELNDAVSQIKLTNLAYKLSALKNSATATSDLMSLRDVQGNANDDNDYVSLIENGTSQIKNLEKQNSELKKQQKNLDVLSEKYQEIAEQIASNNSEIMQIKQSQEQWNDAIIDLRISELQDYRSELEKTNSQYQRQKDLQNAILELEKAKTQKTVRTYVEGQGFVYQADEEAVRTAQENFDTVLHNETLSKIDDVIDVLTELKDNSNVYDRNGNLIGTEYQLPNISNDLIDNLYASNNILTNAIANAQKDAYEQIVSGAKVNTVTSNIGDINLYGVDNVDDLANAIKDELPNAVISAMYSK